MIILQFLQLLFLLLTMRPQFQLNCHSIQLLQRISARSKSSGNVEIWDINVQSEAQIFLSTATRTVRFSNGALETVRIPDAILRVGSQDDEALIHALNSLSNQWDALFS